MSCLTEPSPRHHSPRRRLSDPTESYFHFARVLGYLLPTLECASCFPCGWPRKFQRTVPALGSRRRPILRRLATRSSRHFQVRPIRTRTARREIKSVQSLSGASEDGRVCRPFQLGGVAAVFHQRAVASSLATAITQGKWAFCNPRCASGYFLLPPPSILRNSGFHPFIAVKRFGLGCLATLLVGHRVGSGSRSVPRYASGGPTPVPVSLFSPWTYSAGRFPFVLELEYHFRAPRQLFSAFFLC